MKKSKRRGREGGKGGRGVGGGAEVVVQSFSNTNI